MATSTRDRILDATIDVIVASGAARVRVHHIAASCGITATTIYRHFGDRRGLINAAQAERDRRVSGGFGPQFVERALALQSKEEFRTFVATVWRWFLENPDFKEQRRLRAFLIGSSEGLDDLRAAFFSVPFPELDNIITVFTHAQERGWIRPSLDVYGVSILLVSMLNGRAALEFEEAKVDLERLNEASVDALLRTLFNDEGAPEGAPTS